MKSLKFLLASIIALLFTTSCASVVKAPEISIDNVKLGYVSIRQSSATFTLSVKNPNRFPIALSGIEYALNLNGVSVANGEKSDKIRIAAGAEEVIQIPVNLRVGAMVKMIPTFLRDRQFKYELRGKVKTPLINIPFNRIGGIGVSE